MSKKIDLDQYLSRYNVGCKSPNSSKQTGFPFHLSRSPLKIIDNSQMVESRATIGPGQYILSANSGVMPLCPSQFHKSQGECLELLYTVRRKLES